MGKKWKLPDFEIEHVLGEGKFGTVYFVKEKASGQHLAMKKISKYLIEKNNNVHLIRREVEIHSKLIHPNIVRLYGYFHDAKYIYVVLEFLDRGTLYDFLKINGKVDINTSKKVIFIFLYEIR